MQDHNEIRNLKKNGLDAGQKHLEGGINILLREGGDFDEPQTKQHGKERRSRRKRSGPCKRHSASRPTIKNFGNKFVARKDWRLRRIGASHARSGYAL